jgi:gas vesicle protein
MGQDPSQIREQLDETRAELADRGSTDAMRADIAHTRSEMSDTVGALGHKADVKGRVSQSVSAKKNAVLGAFGSGKDAVVGSADALVSRVTGVVPDKEQITQGAEKVGISKQSPIGLVVVGGAAGLLAGLLIPSTRMEDERIGEMADQMKETVKETGSEAIERSKQVAQEASAAASESAGRQGRELTETLQENVKQAAPTASA